MDQSAPCALDTLQVEHLWIEMPDTIRLAARLWLPSTAHVHPVPAVFEYIPYRKGDMVRARDERNHPFLAAHGFASLRVDMRGSGDSEGLMRDMYSDEELADARHVIEWIARQPWCNGCIGMFGTSWGGTASLQAGVDAPPELKAVIAVCATHDRYEDDIHHKGGCLLTDSIEWGATLPAILALPPNPANIGENWRIMWRERLDRLHFPLETWIREEARGSYWRHGSVSHQTERLSCPLLVVGGWSDLYSNSVMSLVDARPDIAWGVVGPWGHQYPDQGHPGPAIGFQQLMLDWWSHWLTPAQAPSLDWPRLRCWLCEFDEPRDVIDRRQGRWIESDAPSRESKPKGWHLTSKGLAAEPDSGDGAWPVPYDLRVGLAAGETGYFGRYGGQPLDQRQDDMLSLTFETQPLEEDFVLYGASEVALQVISDEPSAQLSARINDVAPEGTSCRVALSIVNLALDEKFDEPSEPHRKGQRCITLRFHSKAYRFKAGHRLRLSISASYWPLIWPAPRRATIDIQAGQLNLPCLVGRPRSLKVPWPAPLDLPQVKNHSMVDAPPIRRFAQIDLGMVSSGWHQPCCSIHYNDIQATFSYETRAEHRINSQDPLSASSLYEHRMEIGFPHGEAAVRCSVIASCDEGHFQLQGEMEARWNGEVIVRREWTPTIPRLFS